MLKLRLIRSDAGTQSRAAINEEVVSEYAERMLDGEKFPPITVFFDGNQFYLADGFHRFMAAHRNEFLDFECVVLQGTRVDALRHSLGANAGHGLRRTNADKRRSVQLAFAEWPDLSDREIARICAVSNNLVGEMRHQVSTADRCPEMSQVSSDDTCPKSRQGSDGKRYPVRQRAVHRDAAAVESSDAVSESHETNFAGSANHEQQTAANGNQKSTDGGTRPQTLPPVASPEKPAQATPANGHAKSRFFVPPALDPSDDCVEAMGITEGEPEEMQARVEYHMELIKADMEVLVDRLRSGTLEMDDLKAAVSELRLAGRIFVAYADTILSRSQN